MLGNYLPVPKHLPQYLLYESPFSPVWTIKTFLLQAYAQMFLGQFRLILWVSNTLFFGHPSPLSAVPPAGHFNISLLSKIHLPLLPSHSFCNIFSLLQMKKHGLTRARTRHLSLLKMGLYTVGALPNSNSILICLSFKVLSNNVYIFCVYTMRVCPSYEPRMDRSGER